MIFQECIAHSWLANGFSCAQRIPTFGEEYWDMMSFLLLQRCHGDHKSYSSNVNFEWPTKMVPTKCLYHKAIIFLFEVLLISWEKYIDYANIASPTSTYYFWDPSVGLCTIVMSMSSGSFFIHLLAILSVINYITYSSRIFILFYGYRSILKIFLNCFRMSI